MSEPEELSVEINGFSCRVWRKGQGPKARLSRRFWRVAAVDPVPRRAGARAHGHRAVIAGFPGRRARPYGARQPSRLGAGGASAAAEGRARRRRSGRQLGRRLVCRRGGGDLAGCGAPTGADRALGSVRREGPDDRSLGAAGARRAGAALRRPRALEPAQDRAGRRQLAGMADRADARQRGRGARLLAARQHAGSKSACR